MTNQNISNHMSAFEKQKKLKIYEINKLIPKREGNSFMGVEFRPKNIQFATQNSGEYVFILIRKHWTTNIGWIFRNIFSIFMLVFFIIIYQIFSKSIPIADIYINLVVVNLFFLIITSMLKDFLDWYFDMYIITNDRIIYYEFKPYRSYLVKETMLENIEQVKEDGRGFISGLFGYGNITISTESDKDVFVFKNIPFTTRVRDVVSDLSQIAKRTSFYE